MSPADHTAARQRKIQKQQDAADASQADAGGKPDASDDDAVQAGARIQPDTMPAQHQAKPGSEAGLALAPRFSAPDYEGSRKLEGMTALITGGDSGIGRSVAVLFAREGADIAIVYLNSHQDAEETKRWVEKEGRRCLLIAGDVRRSAFCDEAVARTVAEFGGLHVLVNNAAFQEHAHRIEEVTDERLQETLQTNIAGYFYMARAAVPHLKAGASIINTGSVVGLRGSARLLDYSTTKGAIHAFTKALAVMSR